MSDRNLVYRFARTQRDAEQASKKKEKIQVCIKPDSYIGREITYQTALLHEILEGINKGHGGAPEPKHPIPVPYPPKKPKEKVRRTDGMNIQEAIQKAVEREAMIYRKAVWKADRPWTLIKPTSLHGTCTMITFCDEGLESCGIWHPTGEDLIADDWEICLEQKEG